MVGILSSNLIVYKEYFQALMGLWLPMISLAMPPDLQIEKMFATTRKSRPNWRLPVALEGQTDGHWQLSNPAPHGPQF